MLPKHGAKREAEPARPAGEGGTREGRLTGRL